MTKQNVEELSCCLSVRGVQINPAADSMAKIKKTEFSGNGCWLRQHPKTHGNANRPTFDEDEGIEPFRKKICLKGSERIASLWEVWFYQFNVL